MAADPQPHDVELAIDDGMAHREGRASVRSPRHLVDADDTGQLLDAQPGAKPRASSGLHLPQIVDEFLQPKPETISLS